MLKLGIIFVLLVVCVVIFTFFWKKRNLEITSLSDKRLVMIDPSQDGFYDTVLNYCTEQYWEKALISLFRITQEKGVDPFFAPFLINPSITKNGKVVFIEGTTWEVNQTYNWVRKKIQEMSPVEGKSWKIGNSYQYYAFLIYLINYLVESGYTIEEAFRIILINDCKFGGELTLTMKILSSIEDEDCIYILGAEVENSNPFWAPLSVWDKFDKVLYNACPWVVLD